MSQTQDQPQIPQMGAGLPPNIKSIMDILGKPALSDPTSSSAFPPQLGASDPGITLSANPNNNFILQAIGAGAPSYNPNNNAPLGVPIANNTNTNSQTTPGFVGNMPRPDKNISTPSIAQGSPNG